MLFLLLHELLFQQLHVQFVRHALVAGEVFRLDVLLSCLCGSEQKKTRWEDVVALLSCLCGSEHHGG